MRISVGCRRPTAGIDFGMESRTERVIELVAVGALEHYRQIIAVDPILFLAELGAHPVVKGRSGQGISDRHTDVVGLGIAHEPDSGLNIVPFLAGIAELKE